MRAVLDPNVLVSALIAPNGVCAELLRLHRNGHFVMIASPALMDELRDALSRDKFRRYVTIEVAEAYVTVIEAAAEIHEDPAEAPAVSPDEGDDYLLALATEADADVRVSGDSHLIDLPHPPISIVTPRAYLEQLTQVE